MTFRHAKFEDSPTMRALEKVAREKGLIKPEEFNKQASVKRLDFTPSDNLMENIIKLCAGLRTVGLAKEATEIETNYFNYKQAQTLYETSAEKGEDLIQSAHPKGSHKLEGVEGDEAVFEDILEQHLKSVKMVEKKPTGKLSEAKSIINKVKIALAQENPNDIIAKTLDKGKALWSGIDKDVVSGLGYFTIWWSNNKHTWNNISDSIKEILNSSSNELTLDQIESLAENVRAGLDFVTGLENKDLSSRIQKPFEQMFTLYGPLKHARDQINSTESSRRVENYSGTPKSGPPSGPNQMAISSNSLIVNYQSVLGAANRFKELVELKKLQNAPALTQWLDKAIKILQDNIGKLQSSPNKDDETILAEYQKQLTNVTDKLGAFKMKWLSQ